MATHWEGPLLGSARSGRGLFEGMPAELAAKRTASYYFNDFHDAADSANWVVTNIASGTASIVQDSDSGVFRLNNQLADQGLGSVQLAGANIVREGLAPPEAGRSICFAARVTCNHWSNCDWFLGLGEADTTFMTAGGIIQANGGDNHVGFTHLQAGDGTPILSVAGTAVANVENPTGTGAAASALTDLTYYEFGVRVEDLNKVRFYMDGVPVSAWHQMGHSFADDMTATFCMISNGVAINFDVDYVLVGHTR